MATNAINLPAGYQTQRSANALATPRTVQTAGTASAADSMLGNLFSKTLADLQSSMANYQAPSTTYSDAGRPSAPTFTYQENPYLAQQAAGIRSEANQNLQRNILPSIGSQAIATGGFGGSRQGVVEANALNDVNRASTNAISNLYAQDYQNSMNRQLQQYGMDLNAYLTGRGQDQSYSLGQGNLNLNAQNSQFGNMLGLGNLGLNYQNSMQNYALGLGNLGLGQQNSNNNFMLGLGNLGLGAQNAQNNFYTAQRGQDLQQLGLGAGLFQQGNTGFLGQGQGIYGLGTTQQQAPWQTVNNANAGMGQWSGYGTTTSSNTGGGALGALGGGLAGGQVWGLLGGGGSQLGQMSNADIAKSWGV